MTGAVTGPTILSVGRFYCDLIFSDMPRLPSLGTEVFAEGFSAHAGGGAYITGAHLADLGNRTCLAAFLPPPPYADLIATEIATAGVETGLSAALTPQDGPQLTVAMAHGSDRAFLSRRAGGPFPALTAAQIRAQNIRHVHIGELASAIEAPAILGAAREAGATVSLDCGWDDALTAEAIAPILPKVDVFLPNEAEVAHLRALGIREFLAPLTVIKRGAAGATAMAGETTLSAATQPFKALDTTGAGDAFNAGFLSAWLQSAPLAACLDAGNARGGLAVRKRGGFQTAPKKPKSTQPAD